MTVDEYVAKFPEESRSVLEKMRNIIHLVMPEAQEVISYQIPAFRMMNRIVIYFAGWKHHVSIYPIPQMSKSLEKRVEKYVAGRGTLKFLLKDEIPYDLIREVAEASLDNLKKRLL